MRRFKDQHNQYTNLKILNNVLNKWLIKIKIYFFCTVHAAATVIRITIYN